MELELEVKGYIQDFIAKKFSWDKIETFGLRVGVDTSFFDEKHKKEANFTKRKACEYIIKNLPKDKGEIVIKAIVDMSKLGTWDEDFSKEMLSNINSIMEKTMKCRVDENGEITPIFPWLEQNLILKKLDSLAFNNGFNNYKEAYNTYMASPKGALGLLRSALEGIVHDILNSKNISPTKNQKDNFAKLKELKILKELSNKDCPQCHYAKDDYEFNYAYNIYGLLSHYGSHKELVTEELAKFLFITTSAFIWFLIDRYENIT